MKIDRQKIYDKFGGHCAYCGEKLQKGWHIDELKPVVRSYKFRQGYWQHMITGEKIQSLSIKPEEVSSALYNHIKGRNIPNGCYHPENYNFENQMPACASCNINKHSLSLEAFRDLIMGFMNHLNKRNTQYKIAKRYGLVYEDIKPIIFYFEKQ